MKLSHKEQFLFWALSFAANFAVIYIASITYPTQVVLGNSIVSPFSAGIITALILTLLLAQVMPFIKTVKIKVKKDNYWAAIFAVANIGLVWLLARFAVYTGFGIASVVTALILGLILNLVQYGIWRLVIKK